MPVLIQWKWQENTKTYLVIFHFLDDFSVPNLRMTNTFVSKGKYGDGENVFKSPHAKSTPLMTWAPSHLELGLLSEILSYANIINGLDYDKRLEIRDFLEGMGLFAMSKNGKLALVTVAEVELLEASQFRQLVYPSKEGVYQAFWLTPEYIEYLKKVLKRVQEPHDFKVDFAVKVYRFFE